MATSFKISKDILDDNISGMNTLVVPNTNTFPAVNQPGNIVYKADENTFYGQGATIWIPFAGIGTVDGVMAADNDARVYGTTGVTAISFGTTSGIGGFQIGIFNNDTTFVASKTGIYNVSTRIEFEAGSTVFLYLGLNGDSSVDGTFVTYEENDVYNVSVNILMNAADFIFVRKVGVITVNTRYLSICLVQQI